MEGVGLPPCDPGFHWDEAQQKCVPDGVVPPNGDVLWDSNTNGHWNNGNSRVITSAHQFDPDDPTTEVAAGSDRRFEVKGDGTALLSGARARIYTHVNNYNAEMEITYIPNSSLDNLSLRLRSRHNEPDPTSNRFGGYGCTIHPNDNNIEYAREDYHNVHTDPPNASYSFPSGKSMQNGKIYTVRFRISDVGSPPKPKYECWIKFDGDNDFTFIGSTSDPSPLSYMIDPSRYLGSGDKSYVWVRTNGSSPENVELKRLIIRNITPYTI